MSNAIFNVTVIRGLTIVWTHKPGEITPETTRVLSVLDQWNRGPARLVYPDGTTQEIVGGTQGTLLFGHGPQGPPTLPELAELARRGAIPPELGELGAELTAGSWAAHHDLTADPDPDPMVDLAGFARVGGYPYSTVKGYHVAGILPPADGVGPRGGKRWRTSTVQTWTNPRRSPADPTTR